MPTDDVTPIRYDIEDQIVDRRIAYAYDAKAEDVEFVLNAPVDTGDGRSPWYWIRLANGDLLLGTFPQGNTYEALEGTFQ